MKELKEKTSLLSTQPISFTMPPKVRKHLQVHGIYSALTWLDLESPRRYTCRYIYEHGFQGLNCRPTVNVGSTHAMALGPRLNKKGKGRKDAEYLHWSESDCRFNVVNCLMPSPSCLQYHDEVYPFRVWVKTNSSLVYFCPSQRKGTNTENRYYEWGYLLW